MDVSFRIVMSQKASALALIINQPLCTQTATLQVPANNPRLRLAEGSQRSPPSISFPLDPCPHPSQTLNPTSSPTPASQLLLEFKRTLKNKALNSLWKPKCNPCYVSSSPKLSNHHTQNTRKAKPEHWFH